MIFDFGKKKSRLIYISFSFVRRRRKEGWRVVIRNKS